MTRGRGHSWLFPGSRTASPVITHRFAHGYRCDVMQCDQQQRQRRQDKRAGHSKHWVLTANIEQDRPIISGFGVRVPGGAHQPRSRQCPGLCCSCSGPQTNHFPGRRHRTSPLTAAVSPAGTQLAASPTLHLIVTVRHLTSACIVASSQGQAGQLPGQGQVPRPRRPSAPGDRPTITGDHCRQPTTRQGSRDTSESPAHTR
jgi:hypothetical protein